MKRRFFIISLSVISLVMTLSTNRAYATQGYYPYLHQRTMYLDNLLNKNGWWSNPALPASIKKPSVYSGTITPLANYYLITSGRVFVPLAAHLTAGVGILGMGQYTSGSASAQARADGFSYSSRFDFTNPRFQLGLAGTVPVFPGHLGAMVSVGWTTDSIGGVEIKNRFSPGLSLGWLSPMLKEKIRLSWSFMWLRYSLVEQTDEITQKIGIQAIFIDSLLTGSLEYTQTPGQGYGLLAAENTYEVLKGLIYIRAFSSVALLTGLSMDTDATNRHNGFALHGGVSIPERKTMRFSGSYEIGARIDSDWLFIHQVSFRFNLAK